MTPINKQWESLKNEYLHKVKKALSSVKHPRSKEVLDDVRAHLDRRFYELAPRQQTSENLQNVITEMGPAGDYAELLEPQVMKHNKNIQKIYFLIACVAAIVFITIAISLLQPEYSTVNAAILSNKIAKFNIDQATLLDVIDVFGEPEKYIWGNETYNKDKLPIHFLIVYPGNFMVFMSDNKVIEIRHEGPGTGYIWQGKLRVGDSLERALDVIGKPVKTVVGKENNFEDGVLYKDIEGRKGYCYYARTDRKIRLWFGNYKIMSIYTTRSNYGDASSRKMEKADIPQTSTIDEKGRIIDKIDYPFINDPEAIGAWESVDFVQEIEYFKPGVKSFGGDLFLKELFVLEEGKTNWAWRWTKGLFLHPVDKTASKYLIKDIDGTTYMFFEWKSGDYVFRHTKPSFYVLKKVNKPYVESRITDNIDYPFVNEPEIVGTWKSIDFVNTPDEFKPDSLRWKGELILKELVFLPDGKMKNSQDTWTKGLVLDPANKTASRYIIKKIDDSAYMLYELKNGDYIYRGMKPKYYVFKKE